MKETSTANEAIAPSIIQERVVWNPARSIPAKDFEFTDPEAARIKAAIQSWDSYGARADRGWLQTLFQTLFSCS